MPTVQDINPKSLQEIAKSYVVRGNSYIDKSI